MRGYVGKWRAALIEIRLETVSWEKAKGFFFRLLKLKGFWSDRLTYTELSPAETTRINGVQGVPRTSGIQIPVQTPNIRSLKLLFVAQYSSQRGSQWAFLLFQAYVKWWINETLVTHWWTGATILYMFPQQKTLKTQIKPPFLAFASGYERFVCFFIKFHTL